MSNARLQTLDIRADSCSDGENHQSRRGFTTVALPRLSILCLYLRVFGWKGPMRRATQAVMGFVVATWFGLVLTTLLQCQSLKTWLATGMKDPARCINEGNFFRGQCIPGFVLDLFIMALPLRTIWSLKLPTAKRVALLCVFVIASL